MIRSLFEFVSFVFKITGKIVFYIFKGVSWYLSQVLKIFGSYPKRQSKKVVIKSEIL